MKRILIFSVLFLFVHASSISFATSKDAIQISEMSEQESVLLKAGESGSPFERQVVVPGWGDRLTYYTLSLRSAIIYEPVYIGVKWSAAEMAGFDDWKVEQIRFLLLGECLVDTMLLHIWKNDQIGAPVYTQEITDIKNGLNTIDLDQKLIIDGTSDFYVGFYLVPRENILFIMPTGRDGVDQKSNLYMNPAEDTEWTVKNYLIGRGTLAWPIEVLITPNSPLVTPEVVDWGNASVGKKKTRIINIANPAPQDITVSEIKLVENYINGFSVNPPPLPMVISSGLDQDFEVYFEPELYGPYTALCQVITSFPPDTTIVKLKGGGGDYAALNITADRWWRGTTDPPTGFHYFPKGAVVPIKAFPNPEITYDTRYLFKNWTGGVEDSSSAETFVVMDSHKLITANFKSARFHLTALSDPPDGGQVIIDPDTTEYRTRDLITLVADPDTNYHFTHWQCGDSSVVGSDTLVVIIETDTTFTAVFEPDTLVTPDMAFAYPDANTEHVPSNASIQFGIQNNIFTLDPASLSFSVNGKAIVAKGTPVSDKLDVRLNCTGSFIQVAYFPENLPENESITVDLAFAHQKMSDKPLEKSFSYSTVPPVAGKLQKLPLDGKPMMYEWLEKEFALDVPEKTVQFPFILHWGEAPLLDWTIPDGMTEQARLFYFGPSKVTFNEPLILSMPSAITGGNTNQPEGKWAIYYCAYQGAEWELVQEAPMGKSIWDLPIQTTGWYLVGTEAVPTGIEEVTVVDFALHGNYPNPFNPETQIRFDLPVQSKVTLTIYNNLGQVIRTLINQDMEAGPHSERWDGKDNQGNLTSSGIYVIEMRAQDKIFRKKMTLLR